MTTSFADRVAQLPVLGAGLGYRGPLSSLFAKDNAQANDDKTVRCVEVVAEHFFFRGAERPVVLQDRPVMVHALDLSLGSPEPVDDAYVQRLVDVQRALSPVLLSDHLCFTKAHGVELGHLNPIPPTLRSVRRVVEKIRQVQETTDSLFLVENITTHLRLPGELKAAEFYQRVCDEADCGMLLDVTNVLVTCKNFGYDPLAYLDALDLSRVVQLHVVGYTTGPDGTLFDTHTENTSDDVFDLVQEVLARAPVKAAIIERDGNHPADDQLLHEVARLQSLFDERDEDAVPTTTPTVLSSTWTTASDPAPDGEDFLDVLVELLTNEETRASFAQAPSSFATQWPLSTADRARLIALDVDELQLQAEVQMKKRLHEVMEMIPLTVQLLGGRFASSFRAYAKTAPWPTGHLRHVEDAVAFAQWLEREQPEDHHGQEATRLLGHLAWRRDRKRWTGQLTAGRDTGPLLHWTVTVHARRRSVTLLFPLPWPRRWWRRSKQTQPAS